MSALPLLSSRLLSENLSENLRTLLDQQKDTWALLRSNYASLDAVSSKELECGSSTILVQHNSARITSTAARVDAASVQKRPCFLCVENLPQEQRAVKYNEEFLILCNPFPIFPEHFTVTHIRHVPQSIEPALSTLLSLSKDLEDEFVVLYNGPRCGASAPDHLHLQVGNAGFLPLEEEYERLITDAGEKVADRGGVLVFAVDSGLRRFVAIESDEQEEASEACRRLFRVLQEFFGDAEEPMMNILSWYKEGEWKVVVFPRAKHRPSVFYDQQNGLLVSPAAVDLAGVVITPRAEDFARITTDDVEAIFHEVLISPDAFEKVRERLVMSYGRMP
jgi:ATP adenylyltransferase/5',5'''-P-1,P-4-tetraphosphate phosphorylase II